MKNAKRKPASIKPGGIGKYIAGSPKSAQKKLAEIRAVIRTAAPDAIETVSYFGIPGYSYEGYDYNGMFAWFSFKEPFVRLHVRPPAIVEHKKDLGSYQSTKAVVSFPVEKPIPKALVRKLVKASLRSMKGMAV